MDAISCTSDLDCASGQATPRRMGTGSKPPSSRLSFKLPVRSASADFDPSRYRHALRLPAPASSWGQWTSPCVARARVRCAGPEPDPESNTWSAGLGTTRPPMLPEATWSLCYWRLISMLLLSHPVKPRRAQPKDRNEVGPQSYPATIRRLEPSRAGWRRPLRRLRSRRSKRGPVAAVHYDHPRPILGVPPEPRASRPRLGASPSAAPHDLAVGPCPALKTFVLRL